MSCEMKNSRPSSRRSSLPSPTSPSTPDSQIAILYCLPDVRIIEFNPSNSKYKSICRNETSLLDVEPGTLSWASRFERTIAVGSLRIYRAPGSVAFLNCQDVIRPILPKSQAWCVDGESKFVLRSPPLFWRIEVPNTTSDESARIEDLKKVFDQILCFEKMPCPFRREIGSEEEDLVLPPIPTKKKSLRLANPRKTVEEMKIDLNDKIKRQNRQNTGNAHRRIANRLRSSSNDSKLMPKITPKLFEKHNTLEIDFNIPNFQISKPANQLSEKNLWLHNFVALGNGSVHEKLNLTSKPFIHSELLDEEKLCKNPCQVISEPLGDRFERFIQHSKGRRNTCFELQSIRQFSADLSGFSFCKSSRRINCNTPPIRVSTDCRSDVSSCGSFHSLQSWHSPLDPPSPFSTPEKTNFVISSNSDVQDDSKFSLSLDSRMICQSKVTKEAVNVESPLSSNSSKTSTLIGGWSEKSDENNSGESSLNVSKTLRQVFSNRCTSDENNQTNKTRLLTPDKGNKTLQIAHQLPSAIMQKTFEVLFSPPSHLFQLMLNIASRITSGEWKGVLSNYGKTIQWDFQDEYGEMERFEEETKKLVSR